MRKLFPRLLAGLVAVFLAVFAYAEVRKLGSNDLYFATPNQGAATTTTVGTKAVTNIDAAQIPFRNANAYVDNLVNPGWSGTIYPRNLTGDNTGTISGYLLGSYTDNVRADNVIAKGSPWVDVTAYGAKGDNTTDDTTAIQNAIDNATGTVYFPPGRYKITASLNLKSSISMIGAGSGGFTYGLEHPAANRGVCLVWAGAASGTMVSAMNTQWVWWQGIDLDGVLYSDGVTGFLWDTNNTALLSHIRMTNFRVFNCGTAIKIGPDSGDNNSDHFQIDFFQIYMCNVGIHTNTQNTSLSSITNGSIAVYKKGIYLQRCGYLSIRDTAFAGHQNMAAGDGFIVIGTNGVVNIVSTQGESGAFTGWKHIVWEAGASYTPVTLIANHFDYPLSIPGTRKVTSISNLYRDAYESAAGAIQFTADSASIVWLSLGDFYYNDNAFINDLGSNNTINEIDPYYTGGVASAYAHRIRFDNTTYLAERYNGVTMTRPLQSLTANSATPSVAEGNLFQTQNTNPTTITNFTGGVAGQAITVIFGDAQTTIDYTASNIRGNSGVDNTYGIGDFMNCTLVATYWYCTPQKMQ